MITFDIETPVSIGDSFRETLHLPNAGSANASRGGRGGNIGNQARSWTFSIFFSAV
jgi:hypothetical protein